VATDFMVRDKKKDMGDGGFFKIGAIVNTHGIHGEIRVLPSTDDPGRFALLKSVFIVNKGIHSEYALERTRLHKAFVIIKVRGVDDRTTAERFIGGTVWIPPDLALPLSENEYYHRDLLDLEVVTETGEPLGILSNILETGANDVYVVRSNQSEVLIPAIKECIISVGKTAMTVRLMDGLR